MKRGLRFNLIHGLYCEAFGTLRGTMLWYRMHRHVGMTPGSLFSLRVPGLRHPVQLRAGTTDVTVFLQIVVERELEIPVPHPVEFIVDAGANVGLSSVYLANRYPRARIVALEVEERNFAVLCRNTAGYPNIQPMRAALWTGRGFVKVVNEDSDPWAFRVAVAEEGQPGAVPCVGVPDLLAAAGGKDIDLFKMDVEGAEGPIFSASGASDWLRHIGTLMIETHDSFAPGSRRAVEDALRGRVAGRDRRGEYEAYHLAGSAEGCP